MSRPIDSSTPSSVPAWGALIGLLLIVAASLMPLLGVDHLIFGCTFSVGAALVFISRITTPRSNKSLRLRRLHGMQFWGALAFVVAAFFIFYPSAGPMDWLPATIVGSVLYAYSSLLISRLEAK